MQNSRNDHEWRWDFHKPGDPEGWRVDKALQGVVIRGSLCIRLKSGHRGKCMPVREQNYPGRRSAIRSPRHFCVPARRRWLLRMRVMNLSPETDGIVEWKSTGISKQHTGSRCFHMLPFEQTWQDVDIILNE